MRNIIIDQLRGLCMLGVIGIHVGSISAAANNFSLYMLLEILSRYSVPSFFFVSGYGLFCAEKKLLAEGTLGKLDYFNFIKKRFKGAGLPYLAWSLFYNAYFWYICPPGWVSFYPKDLSFNLFFGLCCYHLYFMVILLWFYGSYPIWRQLIVLMERYKLILTLPLLFLFQLAFNWLSINYVPNTAGWPLWAKNFYDLRLNYLPFHYLLIFMSGGLAALHWEAFIGWLRNNKLLVWMIYLGSIAYDLGSCYYSYTYKGYDLEALANTYHQLSPQGLLYTIGSLLCFCLMLDWLERTTVVAKTVLKSTLLKLINIFSKYATLIYFIHPLFLDIFSTMAKNRGIVLTSKKITLFYIVLLLVSLLSSKLLTSIFNKIPLLKLLFTGKK